MRIMVIVTPRELDERGVDWAQELPRLDIVSERAIREGRVDFDSALTLTQEQATRLGLLPPS